MLDIYNSNGETTGRVVERSAVKVSTFNSNEHIAVSIIYIENHENEFLIQKTSKEKGGLYSSTGGHIDHGQTPKEAIIREVREELGIAVDENEIVDLGFMVVDFPIRFVFYLKKDIDLKDVVLQKEEVDSVSYMSVNKIKSIIEKGLMIKGHAKVFEKILEYKTQNKA